MGGLAVSVEWAAGPAPELFDAMVSSMGHRGPAGIRTTGDGTALIAEARLPRDGHDGWHIATLGPLTLVGDLRLWTTDDLAHASGTDTDDPRMLVLHGYAAMGAAVMVLVDGDFAFAIWDADTGTLFAARDRFGIKPLWIQRTATGVRLASGTNQLVAASDPPPAPDDLTVARFLNDEIPYDERSFHDGIVRLMPAHTLTATQATFTTSPYWDLSDIPQRPCDDVPGRFRTLLTDAVERRLAASTRTVSHLSGGLDGSSIAAAAHILTGTGALDPGDFVTVSAIVPGHETDESLWIDEITTAQPFPHRDFTPRIGPIEDYAHDMAVTGTPVAHHVRDLVAATAEIAIEEGADLVLTGNGGDDVTNDRWVLPELVRTGHGRAWLRAMRSMAGDSPGAAALWGVSSVGSALPAAIKKRLRRSSTETTGTSLLAPRLRTLLEANRTEDTQQRLQPLARDLANGRGLAVREYQEALFAARGLEVSHPYLDRTLVEFVASIPPTQRPIRLGNKALIRTAFAAHLPDSVLSRTTKTVANTWIDEVVATQAPWFTARFPTVPDNATTFIDPDTYRTAITPPLDSPETLWQPWSLMLWLETT
jgi:asparagine synthase (glutamine-hydrolysing)